MQASYVVVQRDELDLQDDRFAIWSYLPNERLALSLARHGMFLPLWLWARGDGGYSLVDGFKRITWAREKGLERIQAMVFPSSSSYEELFLLRAEAKLFGPPLNAAEKAQLISKLNHEATRPYLHDHLLPALQIPPRAEVIAKWCGLSRAGESLLKNTASGAIAERIALELVAWSEEERAEVLALLIELRCSASVQMEMVERVREIALRWHENRHAVLRRPELQAILSHLEWNHRQKTQAVRELLTRWRLPRLQERETRLARDLALLALPQGSQLLHPPAFEGDEWRLLVTFGQPEELQGLLEKVLTRTDFALLGRAMKPSDEP